MSVEKTPNNRWKVRYRSPDEYVTDAEGLPKLDRNGSRLRKAKSRTFDRKKDAEAFERRVKTALAAGEKVAPPVDHMTFRALADDWLAFERDTMKRQPSTIETNASALAKWLHPILGGKQAAAIDTFDVLDLPEKLRKAGASDRTTSRTVKLAGQVLAHGVRRRVLTLNPADAAKSALRLPPQKRQRTPVIVTPLKIEEVRRQILDRKQGVNSLRDAALLAVLAYGGLRHAEALGLKREDYDGSRLHVVRQGVDGVLNETTKNGRSTRWVPLWSVATDDLDAYLATMPDDPNGLLFPDAVGEPWSGTTKRNWDRRVLGARMPDGFVTYDLRHSHVSLLVRGGWDIARIAKRLGHSPQTTVSTYAHAIDEYDGAARIDPDAEAQEARAQVSARLCGVL